MVRIGNLFVGEFLEQFSLRNIKGDIVIIKADEFLENIERAYSAVSSFDIDEDSPSFWIPEYLNDYKTIYFEVHYTYWRLKRQKISEDDALAMNSILERLNFLIKEIRSAMILQIF